MKKSGIGWAGLIAYVVAYDYWAVKTKNETLSSGFYRAANHRFVRYPHYVTCAILLKHLLLPRLWTKYDPLHIVAEKWRYELDVR